MATVREVVQALNDRDGVQGVLILGRDGLTIDAVVADGIDSDSLSAVVPPIIQSCNILAETAGHGVFGRSVIEYNGGKVIVSEINSEVLLAIFLDGSTNAGPLLYELNRHQPAIAELL